MINRVQLLRNIGQFDSVAARVDLARLTLIYAENGRGKTTLAAVLRSLATGEPLPINERRRLGAAHPPEVIVECTGTPSVVRFQGGAWTRSHPELVVFDDTFIDSNVYSGLEVGAEHRQNLHELILGAQGVALARRVDELATRIRGHNTELRTKAAAIPELERHGIDVEQFCALPADDAIDDASTDAERRLRSINDAETVRNTEAFSTVTLPTIDAEGLEKLLAKSVEDLDQAAADAVKSHLTKLGKKGERWIADGTEFPTTKAGSCPFCAQDLGSSPIFSHYRAYFGEAYTKLQLDLSDQQQRFESLLSGDAIAGFERQVQAVRDRHRFWSSMCTIPAFDLDTIAIVQAWKEARDGILACLRSKRADPLRTATLDEAAKAALSRYSEHATRIANASSDLVAANENVERVKETAAGGNAAVIETELRRLQATKARHTSTIAPLCEAYLQERAAKAATEAEKTTAQAELDAYRTNIFPTYQAAINQYLVRFNAGFSVEAVAPVNTPGRPSCTYQLMINAHSVSVGGTTRAGNPTFKNTLSAGDRNTLALAFFLSSIRRHANLPSMVVVLDDPVSSLDEHRQIATVQEARELVPLVGQVIVLSHSKPFLARIWQHADPAATVALHVTRDGVGSSLAAWNVTAENVTEYDRRHARLREFNARGTGDPRKVAESIRPVLEGYLRVACPEDFPPETLLGPFRGVAQQRAAAGTPIMTAANLTELGHLVEYGNRFHHDTNPAWETEQINDQELRGFVRRALQFVHSV